MTCTLVYDSSVFLDATIARTAQHLQRLLEGIVADPDAKLSRLPLTTDAERTQLLDGGSSGHADHGTTPLHRRIEAHAAKRPDARAVTCRGEHLTYRELDERANRLAHDLIARGVQREAHIAVCMDPSFDFIVAVLAIWKAGAVHVPLDPSYPMDRLAVIVEDTAPALVLTQSHLVPRLPENAHSLLCEIDTVRASVASRSTTRPDLDVRLSQAAYVVYTSGTTGKPKGVVATHANLIQYVVSAVARYEMNENDVLPSMARFSFSITFFELFLPLVAGGRLILLEREHVLDFKRLVPTLQESTLVHAGPSLLRKLIGYVRDNNIAASSFRSLRHVSSGGDMVAPDLLEAMKRTFVDAEIFVIYGSSEISCMGCTYFASRERVENKSRVGKPFANVLVRLLDPHMNLVPIGVAGEIWFGGTGITQGYLHRPDLTAEKYVVIDGERFYRTGDMGRFDADGNVEILGRSDFQIKLRGIRIELGDVEATLRMASGVKEGLVALRDINDDKALVAYVVVDTVYASQRGGVNAVVKDVRRFMQQKLPDYMIPSAFVVLDALPTNMNGKVDRKALKAPTPDDLARLRTVAPPKNDIERKLVAIWERVLGTKGIGVEDNFFDVGGDSLKALPVMVEVERKFGRTLPMSLLLGEGTISVLAQDLDPARANEARPSLVQLRAAKGNAHKSALFLIHDGEGETLPYRTLAMHLDPSFAVWGIQPHARGRHPILHTRLHDVAAHYVSLVRSVQPHGPYMLGGLCVGGFIAFEMAQLLEEQGERVELVALIDVAHVLLPPKSIHVTRMKRLVNTLRGRRSQAASPGDAVPPVMSPEARVPGAPPDREPRGPRGPMWRTVAKKLKNVVAYEARTRTERAKNDVRMRMLRVCLDRGLPLPAFTENIPVRVALRFAEKEYELPAPYRRSGVALFRATNKDPAFDGTVIDDTPYVELFDDAMLGWAGRVMPLDVHDMPGGHSSMLQEANVESLAKLLRTYMARATGDITP